MRDRNHYSMSKNQWPILYSKLLYKMGPHFLDRRYVMSSFCLLSSARNVNKHTWCVNYCCLFKMPHILVFRNYLSLWPPYSKNFVIKAYRFEYGPGIGTSEIIYFRVSKNSKFVRNVGRIESKTSYNSFSPKFVAPRILISAQS